MGKLVWVPVGLGWVGKWRKAAGWDVDRERTMSKMGRGWRRKFWGMGRAERRRSDPEPAPEFPAHFIFLSRLL